MTASPARQSDPAPGAMDHTRLEPLHAALVDAVRASDNRTAELPRFDPMARSVVVRPDPDSRGPLPGRALLIEVHGHHEALLHPAGRRHQAELRPASYRARSVPSRLPRLLVHLCRAVGLDPAGRYCTPEAAVRGYVEAMPRTEVQAVLSRRAPWEWGRTAGIAWTLEGIKLVPHHGGTYYRRTRVRLRDWWFPEHQERALVTQWFLEQHRRVQERRQSLRVIQGGKRPQPRPRPHAPGGGRPAA